MIASAMQKAQIIGFDFALELVEINIRNGLEPTSGLYEKLEELKEEYKEILEDE